MPEELKVDCFECKDLEFARNLARSMKEGYGRHNSRRDFRHIPSDLLEAIALDRQAALQRYAWSRNDNHTRVIGRIGDNALRERWQDCEIGDAVPHDRFEHNEHDTAIINVNMISKCVADLPPRTFERVCFRVRSDGEGNWHDEYVWKRIE